MATRRVLSGLQILNGCRPDKRSAIGQDHQATQGVLLC
ncbi:hypothetical protein STM14_0215 [Salmonella enterica subsp. enterica serovar Typhimurium str. 14028S]|uniref:Uncharacterized protein n=2 Tax=Salmonella enterica I TaxID=59201 RepID=A0A0F6AWX9_SALT1|nr:hypothetical protein SPAB_00224 [Salmonella enterica subsp. enterica serovar Paratyphi B str. SPB7]ACY86750.1 hypothetical protein STM14_0215 [Salmonella enterica subsp. enterica serovar Typhimurium str. 14028S]